MHAVPLGLNFVDISTLRMQNRYNLAFPHGCVSQELPFFFLSPSWEIIRLNPRFAEVHVSHTPSIIEDAAYV
jgi:hypothetical protein